MGVITLTTDLGHSDFYQAALKGSIISLYPEVRLVDITHEIPSFDMQRAAFVLKNVYTFFPKGTVHLIGIDTVFKEDNRYVAMKFNGHYFVGADNGIFSIILADKEATEIVELNLMQDLKFLHFPLVDILTKAACHIAKGGELLEIGEKIEETLDRRTIQPSVSEDSIHGRVVYIDSFGNVISNISKELFNKVQKGRKFTLWFKRKESINKLSWHYSEVIEGEKLCLFGISDYLEIAINKGSASKLLGLKHGEVIRIDFLDN